jgi:hypothetical protein
VPSAQDVFKGIYVPGKTPKFLKIRSESIPKRTEVSVHIATVSGMTDPNWNALIIGTTLDNFPYSLSGLYQVNDSTGDLAMPTPAKSPVKTVGELSYLQNGIGASIGNTIVSLAASAIDAIPIVGGVVGAAEGIVNGIAGFWEDIIMDNPLGDGPPPTSGSLHDFNEDDNSDVLTLGETIIFAPVIDNGNAYTAPYDNRRASEVLISIVDQDMAYGPWVNAVDLAFLGKSQYRLGAHAIVKNTSCAFDESVMASVLPTTLVLGNPGLYGGNAVYNTQVELNPQLVVDVGGNTRTGWNIVFVDKRPFAYFNGAVWLQRADLVNSYF